MKEERITNQVRFYGCFILANVIENNWIALGFAILAIFECVLYFVLKYKRHRYFLVSNSFVSKNNITHHNLKVKAKNESEALNIWYEYTKDFVFDKKGDVSCIDWEKL